MQPGHSFKRCQNYNKHKFMKLGSIRHQAPGQLNPITALARQLQARNHEVVFLYSSDAAGLPFVPGPERFPTSGFGDLRQSRLQK
jgi:hypothetical protein